MNLRDRIAAALAAWRGTGAPAIRNDALDHPNGTLSANDALRLGLFGQQGSFGPVVTDGSALQVGTVYACLSKLGGAVSQLPLHEFRTTQAGRDQVNPHSRLWWLLNESPDPAWTASAWKQWIVRCVKLRGDQHTEIIRRMDGEPMALKIHHPDNVVPKRVNGRLRYSCRDVETGEVYGVDQDDMLHFTGFGFDGEKSVSAIKWAARNAIASELGAAEYIGKTITEGGMPRIALEYPNNLNDKQAEDLRKSFAAIYGGQGAKLPLVLAHGGKAHELSISPVDLELLASRRLDKQTICEVMGVPPIIIGDSEKTSSWGTGVEQVMLGWVRFDIAPMLTGWEEELNRKLFRRAGRFVEFSLSGLLRGDSKAQSDSFRAALGGPGTGDGWMTVNEVRALLNLPRLTDPDADKPFRAQRSTETPK